MVNPETEQQAYEQTLFKIPCQNKSWSICQLFVEGSLIFDPFGPHLYPYDASKKFVAILDTLLTILSPVRPLGRPKRAQT